MRVCFVGFVDEFGCACAPFLRSVAIFSHKAEEKIEEVVRGLGEVFYYFVWDCVLSRCYASRCLVAC